ncbi:MAG: hypothetical protein CMF96_00560 [Candidatus Marinimicrobia bacterium]|nr:hypothetical protein [Candidatus Neomarinimicrobiota bacterium]|tara:strand:+ start:2015 stop:2758 length:744 start_codon:yes stop_codon:yes gene_type:complete
MLKKYIISLIIFTIGFSIHPELLKQYQNGLNAYSNSNYQLAVQEMEEILKHNWESPQLYYNLGNAYFRQKNVAGSVWAYEKCLSLNPSHSDAEYNLSLANLNVVDKIDLPEPPIYLKWYNTFRNYFNFQGWLNVFFISLLTLSILIAFRKILNQNWLRNFETLLIIELILLFFVSTHSYIDLKSNPKGIIYDQIVIAYSEPNEYSSKIVEVHEGLKVEILNNQEEWINFELLDGTVGWILKNQIREL